jgi:hypothetical protein
MMSGSQMAARGFGRPRMGVDLRRRADRWAMAVLIAASAVEP